MEGLFTTFERAEESQIVLGRQGSNKNVPRVTERYFLTNVAPKPEKSKPQRKCDLCSKYGKKKLQCTAAKYVTCFFAWKNSLSSITRSSITEVMEISFLHL